MDFPEKTRGHGLPRQGESVPPVQITQEQRATPLRWKAFGRAPPSRSAVEPLHPLLDVDLGQRLGPRQGIENGTPLSVPPKHGQPPGGSGSRRFVTARLPYPTVTLRRLSCRGGRRLAFMEDGSEGHSRPSGCSRIGCTTVDGRLTLSPSTPAAGPLGLRRPRRRRGSPSTFRGS